MSQSDASYSPAPDDAPRAIPERGPLPWPRFFLSLLFAFLAWGAFWFTILLAIVLWILVAVGGEVHPEFNKFVTGFARYVWQCLGYVVMLHEDKPFPLRPLPREE